MLGFLLALSVVMSAEMWNGAWPRVHEETRYVTRAVEYLHSWRDGVWYPRWAPDLYGGYGSPLFDFFPPGVFTLTCALALSGFSILTSLKIATLAITLAGGAGAYWLAKGETGRTDCGLVASAAFLFMPYRFVDLDMRGDLCEYAAIALVPATLHFYRELGRAPPEALPRTTFFAALAQAGTMVLHPVIGLWTIFALPLFFLWPAIGAWRRRDRFRALSPFAAGVGGVGLSAVYAVPAYLDKTYCHFEKMTSGYFTASDHVVPLPLFFKLWFYDFVDEHPPGSRMPFSIGVPLVGAMVLVVPCLLFPRSRQLLRRSTLWWANLGVLLLIMSPAASFVYERVQLAAYIQFPWRLLGLVCAVGAGAIATTFAAFLEVPGVRRLQTSLPLLAIVGVIVGADNFERVPGYYPRGHIQATPAAVAEFVNHGTTSSDEHLPKLADQPPKHPRTKLVVPESGNVTAVARRRTGTDYLVTVVAHGPWTVDVQTFNFPGWRLETLSGPAPVEMGSSDEALVQLKASAPGHYRVHVWFGSTPLRTGSAIVSFLCLLLLWPGLRAISRLRPFRVVDAT